MKKIFFTLFISVLLLCSCGNATTATCKKPGCNNPTFEAGLCRDHYKELQADNEKLNNAHKAWQKYTN